MSFLLKKAIILTTSFAISLFTINNIHSTAHAAVRPAIEENNTNNNENDLNSVLLQNKEQIFIADKTISIISNNTNVDDSQDDNSDVQATSSEEPSTTEEAENSYPGYEAVYTMESTAYTGGVVTANGMTPVRDPNGISTIAVDQSIIPLGSKVYIPGYGVAIAADTGGAIHGNIVDLYLNSYDECIQWGRQSVDVYILAYPGQW